MSLLYSCCVRWCKFPGCGSGQGEQKNVHGVPAQSSAVAAVTAGPALWSFPFTVYSCTEAEINKLALFFPFSVICHLRPKKEKIALHISQLLKIHVVFVKASFFLEENDLSLYVSVCVLNLLSFHFLLCSDF